MIYYFFIFLSIFLTNILVGISLKVPEHLKFGVSTSAFQIEGGWNEGGKGESTWDRFTHTRPDRIEGSIKNGDVTCDSYHKWREDIEILKNIGVDFYRFSIAWTRILPTGYVNNISSDGVRYYNDLIDGLLENNIQPFVTMYHWDHPQLIQDLGGWTNEVMAVYFEQYARLLFSLFGDRVKNWITLNEPLSFCEGIYDRNLAAPDLSSPGIGTYLCGKVALLANARAYHVYDKEFRSQQNGTIGIVLNNKWMEPLTNTTEDIEACEREKQMKLGWFAHPIFSKDGDYPDVMKSAVANRSQVQGFPSSRLPNLSNTEINFIKGTSDFFGLNTYVTAYVSNKEYPIDEVSFIADRGTIQVTEAPTDVGSLGFRKFLNWIKNEYNNPVIYITENGYVDNKGELQDTKRVNYLKGYLTALTQSVTEDGCNVPLYSVWSAIDNWEWTCGIMCKYGLYQVDFNSSNRTRTPKLSASYYKNLIAKREL